MSFVYRLHNLAIASQFPLPLESSVERATDCDVIVRAGVVRSEGEPIFVGNHGQLECRRQSEGITLCWPSLRLLVGEDEIVVDGVVDAAATLTVVQAGWSILLGSRAIESLHAGAVASRNGALIVLGDSGAGKSTALLTLIDRGWTLVADDLLAFNSSGRCLVGAPRMRLRPDRIAGRHVIDDGAGKYWYAPTNVSENVEPYAVIMLASEFSEFSAIPAARAVRSLLKCSYIPVNIHPGQGLRRLQLAASLATRCRVYGAPPRSLDSTTLLTIATIEGCAL